ncbi:MAG: proton-conducting transporter membrane subunit [Gemmatimonadota bacterium]
MSWADVGLLLPEMAIALLALALLALEAAFAPRPGRQSLGRLSLLGVLAALALGLVAWDGTGAPATAFSGAAAVDRYGAFFRVLLLSATAGVILLTLGRPARPAQAATPLPEGGALALVLLAAFGALAAVSAHDLLVLYLGVSLTAVAVQLLVARGGGPAGREAGLRLAQANGLAAALFLAGLGLVWAGAGTTDLGGLARALDSGSASDLILAGLAVMAAGLAGAVLLVPFHLPTADAFEAAPPPAGALLVAGSGAALAALARVVSTALAPMAHLWGPALALAGAITAILASLTAAGQDRLHRFVAALVTANAGFALLGLAAGVDEGLPALMVQVGVQIAAVLGAAGVLQILEVRPGSSTRALTGLARRHPALGLGLAGAVLALAGLPPTAGFVARLMTYRALAGAGMEGYLLAAAASHVVGAYAAVRFLAVTCAPERTGQPLEARSTAPAAAVTALAWLVLVALGLYPAPLVEACRTAAGSLP